MLKLAVFKQRFGCGEVLGAVDVEEGIDVSAADCHGRERDLHCAMLSCPVEHLALSRLEIGAQPRRKRDRPEPEHRMHTALRSRDGEPAARLGQPRHQIERKERRVGGAVNRTLASGRCARAHSMAASTPDSGPANSSIRALA